MIPILFVTQTHDLCSSVLELRTMCVRESDDDIYKVQLQ
jgi:hypothetical protein